MQAQAITGDAAADERRIALNGRVLVGGKGEDAVCTLTYGFDGVIRVLTGAAAQSGQEAVCYVDGIGRVTGTVAFASRRGFVLQPVGNGATGRRVRARLDWARDHGPGGEERRGDDRFVPDEADTRVRLHGAAEEWAATIVDLSRSGIHVGTPLRPPVDAMVFVGRRGARVVRHTDEGFAAQFALPIKAADLGSGFVL